MIPTPTPPPAPSTPHTPEPVQASESTPVGEAHRDLPGLLHELVRALRESPAGSAQDALEVPANAEASASVVPVVLRVQELIEQHSRSEAELEALYDAARDLTRVRDVERTLQSVTERVRRLLRCDVAYLSAATEDEAADFAVRAWSGQLSPQFLGTKVSTGRGVGGKVAASRRPFQVDDYQHAAEIDHTDYLDAQVGAEGIVSLLGVPLEVDGRLLGLLFAGRRVALRFDRNEVRLLASLAAHAAVALDNAALFTSQLATMDELRLTTEALREKNAAVETAAEVHAQLTDVLLHGHGVATIVEIVADALDVGITMLDPSEGVLAAHGDLALAPDAARAAVSPIRPPLLAAVREAIATSRETGRSVVSDGPGGRKIYVNTAAAGATFLGSVLLVAPRTLTDVDVRTFERATQTIAVSLLADAAIAEADQRSSTEVMRQLLDVRRSSPQAVEQIARRHMLAGNPVTVVVTDALAVVPDQRVAHLMSAASRLCSEHGGLCAVYEDQLVLVQPGEDSVVGERVWAQLQEIAGEPVTVAAARPTESLLDLGHFYDEAQQCLRLMRHIERAGSWVTTSDLGMYSLLFTAGMQGRLDHFVYHQAGALLNYDARHGTELADTALAYLEANCSPAAAANRLGIHANTVAQRIGRIDRLLERSWRATPRSLEVHTALRLNGLRADLGQ